MLDVYQPSSVVALVLLLSIFVYNYAFFFSLEFHSAVYWFHLTPGNVVNMDAINQDEYSAFSLF